MVIADLSFSAVAGTEASRSSIAAFVNTSPAVTLLVWSLERISASAGMTSPKAGTGVANGSLDGNSANGTTRGLPRHAHAPATVGRAVAVAA